MCIYIHINAQCVMNMLMLECTKSTVLATDNILTHTRAVITPYLASRLVFSVSTEAHCQGPKLQHLARLLIGAQISLLSLGFQLQLNLAEHQEHPDILTLDAFVHLAPRKDALGPRSAAILVGSAV